MKTKENKATDKKDLSEEELKRQRIEKLKEKFRNVSFEDRNRLYIDDKYKKPGKVLRIDNDDPSTKNYLESLGYSIVREDIKVGSGSLSEPSNMGSAVHIEQGIRLSQPGLLYEIDEDLYQARKEVEAEENDMQLQSTIEANQGHKN